MLCIYISYRFNQYERNPDATYKFTFFLRKKIQEFGKNFSLGLSDFKGFQLPSNFKITCVIAYRICVTLL